MASRVCGTEKEAVSLGKLPMRRNSLSEELRVSKLADIRPMQHRYVEMTLYLTSSKTSFTDKDRHLIKSIQKEKHDTAIKRKLLSYGEREEWTN